MTPSGRRSTAMSRASHSILRNAGFVSIAAAVALVAILVPLKIRVSCRTLFFAAVEKFLPPDIEHIERFVGSSRRKPGPMRRAVSLRHCGRVLWCQVLFGGKSFCNSKRQGL